MKILRAVGFGFLIIILQLLVPRMFSSFEDVVVTTFQTAQVIMSVSSGAVKSGTYPLLPFDPPHN
ncbi:MAG: hypothetical protein V4467_00350 [Patescibacteria group bacterium]